MICAVAGIGHLINRNAGSKLASSLPPVPTHFIQCFLPAQGKTAPSVGLPQKGKICGDDSAQKIYIGREKMDDSRARVRINHNSIFVQVLSVALHFSLSLLAIVWRRLLLRALSWTSELAALNHSLGLLK